MADDEGKASGALAKLTEAIARVSDRAIEGVPGVSGAAAFADEYMRSHPDPEIAIEHLIKWQVIQAGTAGLLTGLGGVIILPVAIPANLVAVLYIQLRMIAAIAHIRGYDLKSEKVKAFVVACLAGSSAVDALKDVGINLSSKITAQMVQRIPGSIIIKLNKAVGVRLLTKAGNTGIINLSRVVPIVGGLVSGGIDAATTRAIATASKNIFARIPSEAPQPVTV